MEEFEYFETICVVGLNARFLGIAKCVFISVSYISLDQKGGKDLTIR